MKFSIIFGLLFSTAAAFGADVKITSFRYLNSSSAFSQVAELCGEVVEKTGQSQLVKIISDPKSNSPGTYMVWTGKNSQFCSVIATFSGLAEAHLE